MENLAKILRDTLVASFYKETQLGRSLKDTARESINLFKKELMKEIPLLLKKVDSNTLKNSDIRTSIKNLSQIVGISVGQAQKVINVYLKVYCLLLNKPFISVLDCPLDSKIMTRFKNRELKKCSLKNLKDFEVYEKWQEHLKEKGCGIRLRADIETYDKQRIDAFLKE